MSFAAPDIRQLSSNGITLRTALMGTGPAVVFCHGMPGLWRSWQHQLPALAEAGYTAIAFDQRGYGGSSRPRSTDAYDSHHTVADVMGLLDTLGIKHAVLVGTDFGAAQVYNCALRHPDRVRAVVGMACPFDFDFSGRGGAGLATPAQTERPFARPDKTPGECFEALANGLGFFYAHWYQQPGVADKVLAAQASEFLQRLLYALSAEGSFMPPEDYPAVVTSYLDILPATPSLPWSWLSRQEFDRWLKDFVCEDTALTFAGGLNAYRNATRNWHINRDWADACIRQPSLFIAGTGDPVIDMIGDDAFRVLAQRSTDLRGIQLIEGAGHFVQMEKPEETNHCLLEFLASLKT